MMAIEPRNANGLVPVFDFETNDPLASIKTMLLMSRPLDPNRPAIAAKFGAHLLGVVESTYVALMTQAAARAAAGGIPELGSLDRLIAGCSDDPTQQQMLRPLLWRLRRNVIQAHPRVLKVYFGSV
jgi:hypothetical protein